MVDAELAEERSPARQAGENWERLLACQDNRRVRIEGENDCLVSARPGMTDRCRDEILVSSVHSVEVSDGDTRPTPGTGLLGPESEQHLQ